MKQYFFHNNEESTGPFSLDELKNKQIKRSTPIWKEGMEDWKNAGEMDELKDIFVSVPPPISKPPVYEPQVTTYQYAAPEKKSNWFKKAIITTIVVLVSLFIIGAISDSIDNSSSSFAEEELSIADKERLYPQNYLSTGGSYKENFLGDKLKIKGNIQSSAALTTYKDVVINIVFYTKTQTKLSTEQYTIFEFFPPGSNKTFELKIKNYSNVGSIGWDIASATAQ